MKIERDENLKITVTAKDGGFISSQSVEAILLYEILEVLKDIKYQPRTFFD